tara:strand:+ start:211 stop:405 length:195 start_codon:yes stop_codon:yes gene_type:complete
MKLTIDNIKLKRILAYNNEYELELLVDNNLSLCDLCNGIFKALCLDTNETLKVNGTLFNIEILN